MPAIKHLFTERREKDQRFDLKFLSQLAAPHQT